MNKVAVEALEVAMGIQAAPHKGIDVSGIAGSWVEDPAFDEAIRDQDRIDPDMWK